MGADRNEVSEAVKKIIVQHLEVSPDKVTPEASVFDLGADSLDAFELATAAEEEFGIELTDEDKEQMVTVKDAIDVITRKAS